MARRVFFSFHHSGDVWRAGQVRNCWVTQDRQEAGFWDAAAWEAVKKKDIATVQKWIDEQMKGNICDGRPHRSGDIDAPTRWL